MKNNTQSRSREVPQWYDDAKLGIFVHWGLYSVPAFAAGKPFDPAAGGMGTLVKSKEAAPELPYAEWYQFSLQNPDGATRKWHNDQYGESTEYEDFKALFEANSAQWDPAEWADLFLASGAKLVVFCAKHHDGYCLWPTSVQNPHRDGWFSQRDLVGELAEAVRARGMRFGLYYSGGLDWTFKQTKSRHFIDSLFGSPPGSQEYADYAYNQFVELIDRYEPSLLWVDAGYPSKGRLDELLEYYFRKVPDGTINDRWWPLDQLAKLSQVPILSWLIKKVVRAQIARAASQVKDDPKRYGYKTVEYGEIKEVVELKWESTRGIGGSFGLNRQEREEDMLTEVELVKFLTDSVSKGGNVLVNVGPDSFGEIPNMQQVPLKSMGEWLKVNGRAIYATRPFRADGLNLEPGVIVKLTQDDECIYLILTGGVTPRITISGLNLGASSAQLLGHGEIPITLDGSHYTLALPEFVVNETPDVPVVIQISK